MKLVSVNILCFLFLFYFAGCKENNQLNVVKKVTVINKIRHAKGFSIFQYKGFSIVKVSNPWPDANKE